MVDPAKGLRAEPRDARGSELHGIVITAGRSTARPPGGSPEPRIAAFVWGGKVRPSPTLPFGRWKGGS